MSPSPGRPVALELPLGGSQLIEASAGTGKTFTIALLYVRLVLGHGQPDSDISTRDNGFTRPLVPPEILVVTFSEAASLELRDRIRERLVQATEAFRTADGDDGLADRDPLLAQLRDDFVVESWPRCARHLETAAQWMDDAAISTIHSWAQRMLREHAFDSGSLFRQEVVKDLTEPTLEAVADYWRSLVYPLAESEAAAIVDAFGSPQGLHERLRRLLQREDADLVLAGEPLAGAGLADVLAQAAQSAAALPEAETAAREAYQSESEAVHAALHNLRTAMNGNTFRGRDSDETFASWLDELRAWGRGEIPLQEAGTFVQKLARGRFRLHKGSSLPALQLWDALQAWHDQRSSGEQLQDLLQPAVLADARERVSQRLAAQLESRAQMGFDGMIRGLASALGSAEGEALAQRIRTRFPVAMIDEFQDTDPAQYRIFRRIYGIDNDAADTALVLIGDPKQAIYGFRGGDIHTYLAARAATQGRHHTLGINFRSSAAAVAAVNHLFAGAESHPQAAFRFADPSEPAGNPLPFHAVAANGRREQLLLDGGPAPALTGWLFPGGKEHGCIGTAAYRRDAAHHCANRIAGWLNQAQAGQAGFQVPGDSAMVPLRARDIAILVRNRTEARAIRDALAARGLASVYLSDKDSVFASPEARDLLHWLRAMANPGDVSALRTALATGTLGCSLAWLDGLQADEMAWEDTQERFIRYRQHWQRRGILPAVYQLLHDFAVPRQLLGRAQGERSLTNLLHLAEWAQQASDGVDGDHALIRLLAEHLAEPGSDEQVLRLESDADLIQVVTIFKSKGLEYPLVLLPFICSFREVDSAYGAPLYHEGHRPVLELGSKKAAATSFERADEERLSEDVRLLYVALTRARHATFLGLAALAPGNAKSAALHRSAPGYLLAGGEKLPDLQSLRSRWQALAEGCPALALEEADGSDAPLCYRGGAPPTASKAARLPEHPAFLRWWVASYSALRHLSADEAPETAGAEIRDEERGPQPAPLLQEDPQRPAPGTLHAFPRGPEPGTFLHGVLEDLANAGFDRAVHDTALLAQMAERCRRRGWDGHVNALLSGIAAWLQTALAPREAGLGEDGPVLAALPRYRAEPDFWFATENAATPAIDGLLRTNLFPGAPRPGLGHQGLNGLMKGFIDLLAEHQGRYFVIDWKSNWLGPDDGAYTEEAMQHALLEKRYDLQLAIYLVALHRHLRHTLGSAYDYERDVGGAMLVFLRGIGAPSRGVIRLKPPLSFIEALDDCFAGAGPAGPAQESPA